MPTLHSPIPAHPSLAPLLQAQGYYFHSSSNPPEDSSLEVLLAAWGRQPPPVPSAPPPAACHAISASLLEHPSLQLRQGATQVCEGPAGHGARGLQGRGGAAGAPFFEAAAGGHAGERAGLTLVVINSSIH